MLNSKSFAGVEPCGIDKFLNVFKETYDDNIIRLETIETFVHEDEDFSFKYKYVLTITDYSHYMDSINPEFPYYAELFLVPLPESMDKGVLKELMESLGVEKADEIIIDDLVREGDSVMFGVSRGLYQISDAHSCRMIDDPIDEGFAEEDIPTIINLVSNTLSGFEMMRGFILDRTINRIGWTGWDVIRKVVLGEELNFYTKLCKDTENNS